jgi:hypothetical protein
VLPFHRNLLVEVRKRRGHPDSVQHISIYSTRRMPAEILTTASRFERSHRLVLTVGYSEVGAFAQVLQSTGEYVDGRVVRRTADDGLDRDS